MNYSVILQFRILRFTNSPVHQCKMSILNVCVIVCRATPSYSFVDYLRGGCEINLIVAVDFTVRAGTIIYEVIELCCFVIYTVGL